MYSTVYIYKRITGNEDFWENVLFLYVAINICAENLF